MKHFSKLRMAGVAITLIAGLATLAEAQNRRVYAGAELQAISCARLFAITSLDLEAAGYLSRRDTEDMVTYAALILDYYVSGTNDQKMAAMRGLQDRHSMASTYSMFERNANWCLATFPIR